MNVFYVQIQAAKTGLFEQFIGLFCLTNKKSGNQFWLLEIVQEKYIFLRGPHNIYFCKLFQFWGFEL